MKKTNQMTNVLVDLKPALDGYAGIPQETRILFSALQNLKDINATGLIQHGGRRLAPLGNDINTLSRFVISITENPYHGRLKRSLYKIAKRLDPVLLIIKIIFNLPVKCLPFEVKSFEDFIWSLLFKKTLKAEVKAMVVSAKFRAIRSPRKHFNRAGLFFLNFFKKPSYPTLDTSEFDFFIAQSPLPAKISANTCLVIRYHDSVPLLMPHTIKDKAYHQATYYYALKQNIEQGAWFACVSDSTRRELISIFPEVAHRSIVIHNVVSEDFYETDSPVELVSQIIFNRINEGFTPEETPVATDFSYLLMVSTIEPRKNHSLLLKAWERLILSSQPGLKLIIVGGIGWENTEILNLFRPWAKRGELFFLSNLPVAELRVLYKHAAATICPSLAEGFDYSGIEAMKSGSVVVSSDIPVHREIYDQASDYFDPYSFEHASEVIEDVLSNRFKDLREAGRIVSERYSSHNIIPKWKEFFLKF